MEDLNRHFSKDIPKTRQKADEKMLNITNCWGFPGGSESKVSACNVGGLGSIHGTGRPLGEGNGNPLQFSCLENPMDREIVHGVARHAKKQMKRCSTSLIIREMQTKTNEVSPQPVRMAIIKKCTNNKHSLLHYWGEYTGTVNMENSMEVP